MVNAIRGRNLTSPEFCLAFAQTVRRSVCPGVNGKQPMFSLYGGFICKSRGAGCVLTRVFLLREEHFNKLNEEGVNLSKLRHLKPISPPFITTV